MRSLDITKDKVEGGLFEKKGSVEERGIREDIGGT
jgi:hypothetical protein